jgi:hypothetical protein
VVLLVAPSEEADLRHFLLKSSGPDRRKSRIKQ